MTLGDFIEIIRAKGVALDTELIYVNWDGQNEPDVIYHEGEEGVSIE